MCGGGGSSNAGMIAQAEQETIRAREEREYQERIRRENLAREAEERIRREAEEAAERARQEAEEERQRLAWTANLNNASNAARTDAEDLFTSRGVDPNKYRSQISRAIERAIGVVPEGSENIGQYFDGIGQNVYDRAERSYLSGLNNAFNQFAYNGFEYDRIRNDADDAYIDAINAERQQEADDKLQTLLKRGVFTSGGYDAASGDLDDQSSRVQAMLNEIGAAQLARGRGDIVDIAGRGRNRLDSVTLGTSFNPGTYRSQIDTSVADFLAGLGDNIRAAAPDDLFDLETAFGAGGFGQGAQNTVYDPNASAGIFALLQDDEDEDEDKNGTTKARKNTQQSMFALA